MVKCPDCNLSMTQHTLKHVHTKRGYCKGVPPQGTEPLEEQQEEQVIVKSPIQHHGLQRQTSITPTNLTNDMVNQYSRKP